MTEPAESPSDTPTPYEPHFTVTPEGALTLDDHEAIAAMLSRAFPSYSHWYQGPRSWAGMQPELRVVARSGDVVVAHAGLRRMFVQVGESELVVAAVGMVAVSPILQGTGLGAALLGLVGEALDSLEVPYGVLEASERVTPFYRKNGWQPLDGLTGHYNDFTADGAATLVSSDSGWLARPTAAALADWPAGDLHWNGQMV